MERTTATNDSNTFPIHLRDEAMFLRKLLLSCLSLTLSASAIAEELVVTKVDRHAVADLNTCAKPVWPSEALRMRQTSAVTLTFLVSTNGQVVDAAIIKSSGHESLDIAALEGIRKCRFIPGMVGGEPVRSWMKLQYVWSVHDSSDHPPGTGEIELHRQ